MNLCKSHSRSYDGRNQGLGDTVCTKGSRVLSFQVQKCVRLLAANLGTCFPYDGVIILKKWGAGRYAI